MKKIIWIIIMCLCFCCFTGCAEKKVEIYQLQPESQSLLNSYVIKTVDEKIIVLDGGIAGYGALKELYLPNAIRAILGLGENEHFTVDAWFLTHPHDDHMGELAKMLFAYDDAYFVTLPKEFTKSDGVYNVKTDKNYTIKNFYFDFPPQDKLCADTSFACLDLLKIGLDKYASANSIQVNGSSYYEDLNSAFINEQSIKDGLELEIDGLKIEFLQTWFDKDPTPTQANDNSLVMRMWHNGKSIMFLGDQTEIGGAKLLRDYGAQFLKSDIVQLAHHGQSGVEKDVYDAIDAKLRLWPCPIWVWQDSLVDSLKTHVVRTWFNMDAIYQNVQIDRNTDIIAGLYAKYPEVDRNGIISVNSWTEEVLAQARILL